MSEPITATEFFNKYGVTPEESNTILEWVNSNAHMLDHMSLLDVIVAWECEKRRCREVLLRWEF